MENGKPPKALSDGGYLPQSPTRVFIDLSGPWTVSSDGDVWQDVRVPSSVDARGTFTFRRTFNATASSLDSHVFKVVALGINHDAEVYINDVYMGRHIGGYTAFQLDIPDDVLQPGTENDIQVVVHNELSARNSIPIRQQSWGWRTYAGILRDIFIVGIPRVWVEDLSVVASLQEATRTGVLSVETVVSSSVPPPRGDAPAVVADSSVSYLFTVSLSDPQTGVVVAEAPPQILIPEPNKTIDLRSTLSILDARVWRPDLPETYRLSARVIIQEGKLQKVVDQFDRTVGFQDVTSRDGMLYESGARLRLRGVVWHEDVPDGGGSLSYDQMEKDLATIKSLGANAVRFAHHPPHCYMLDLCTRYGLYALVELPVWNVPGRILGEELFKSLGEQVARETVEQLRHHPSILAWGVAGCVDTDDERASSFVSAAASAVRSLDNRPVYAATGASPRLMPSLDLGAFLMQGDEVKGFRDELKTLRKAHPNRPLLVLSYGKQVDHENRNGYRDPRSQEAQARFYLQHIAAVKEAGFSGGFVAAFADWRGDRPVLTIQSEDRTVYPLGLLSREREKRLAFDVVRSQYQEEKFPAIPAGTYRARFPASQVIAGLIIIIVVGYQYSYNRRFGESVKRGFLRSYNFFADIRDRGDAPPLATFVLSLCISATIGVVVASVLHHFRTSATMDAMYTMLFPDDGLKEEMINASWNPLRGIALFSAVSFLATLALSGTVRLVAWLARSKTTFAKTWVVSVWGGLPLILLSPVGMSLFKILETPAFVGPSLGLILLVVLWSLIRIMKGVSVILDVSSFRTYSLILLVFVVVFGGLYLFLDGQFALRAAVEHIDVVTGAGI